MNRSCEFACGRPVTCAYVTLDAPGHPHFVCPICYTDAIRASLLGRAYMPQQIPVQTAECLQPAPVVRRLRAAADRTATVALVG